MLALRCVDCGVPLDVSASPLTCRTCGGRFSTASGIANFVRDKVYAEEQDFYDVRYGVGDVRAGRRLEIEDLRDQWDSLYHPANQAVLRRMGGLRGKTILLIGNGTSEKELYFLREEPEHLVISDLSPRALQAVREAYDFRGYEDTVFFAVIDAEKLPFLDGSVDVIYGYAVVHHLRDVDRFLREAFRVLRPGGRAVFLDDAYAPAWQRAKTTWLAPLMRYFHRLEPTSPEDHRFTLAGGFRPDDLAARIRAMGGEPWFERIGLLHYLFTRASERLPPQRIFRRLVQSDRLLAALIRIDRRFARSEAISQNLIRLVWGFEKAEPPGFPSPPALSAFARGAPN